MSLSTAKSTAICKITVSVSFEISVEAIFVISRTIIGRTSSQPVVKKAQSRSSASVILCFLKYGRNHFLSIPFLLFIFNTP